MMISHRYRCIFAHVPKCAGTAIRKALDLQFVQPPYWHCTAREALAVVGEGMFQEYYKFAVVRNPWDRIISAWRMFLEKPWCRQPRDYSLPEFISIVMDESIPYRAAYTNEETQKKWQRTVENIRHHTLPCLHPYYGIAGDDGAVVVDDVIRFESLGEQWPQLARRVGAAGTLPVMNTTSHGDYRDYFDTRERELIRAHYQPDIETFGYTF